MLDGRSFTCTYKLLHHLSFKILICSSSSSLFCCPDNTSIAGLFLLFDTIFGNLILSVHISSNKPRSSSSDEFSSDDGEGVESEDEANVSLSDELPVSS